MKQNIEQAVTGGMSDFALDYAAVTLSFENLFMPFTNSVTVEPGSVTLTWNPALSQFSGSSSDVGYIVVYNANRWLFNARRWGA